MTTPRGIRNNNPGNIRKGAKWQGLSAFQQDSDFCEFDDAIYGIRALMKIIMVYGRSYHLDTVREIITRWAPDNENDTAAYIRSVSDALHVNPDSPIQLRDKKTLASLAKAITIHENGRAPNPPDAWYSDHDYEMAANLLLE
jgi:hypothetical protein